MRLLLKVGSPEWTDSTTRSRGPTVLEAKLARESGTVRIPDYPRPLITFLTILSSIRVVMMIAIVMLVKTMPSMTHLARQSAVM